ncbi:hypothetical protein CRE_15035 [Caenorhabditis remanei]|uniref:Uncharacterized protein n=1 Tax=Caenorhabditis remanei TaxID=31234 RepID=E3NK97_CAERE|nr:hypothetical protein CRE_15035 [Caenorhabditis remanei]
MLHAMRPVLLATALFAVTAHAFLGFGNGAARKAEDAKWSHYHNQEQLETKLTEINEKCPEVCGFFPCFSVFCFRFSFLSSWFMRTGSRFLRYI